MNATANKQLLQDIYAQISKGNLQPLLDSMADDIQWTIIGSTAVSGTSRGKQEVIDKLLKPVRARLADGPPAEGRSCSSPSASSPRANTS
jgi:ketosteroid isomerase-like protein